MGQAASQPAVTRPVIKSPPRLRRGGRRSAAHSLLIAALFTSGLSLWLRPADTPVLWAHLMVGGLLTAALLPWLWHHVPQGLGQSRRRLFTQTSWALLAIWLVLIISGLAMALPAVLWFAGLMWFAPRETGELLSFLHFWSSWAGMAGLGLHLALRHWVWGQA